ncbi:MAG: segregation/condensation protein A [Candidatus Omnitrophica bacterium]|nr:segregation/condensation protein A [Candidatus Omnitrophota bacterium]
MSYKFHLDMFEGPLDLLVYLIKKNEINIYDIPISAIADQYIEYIEMMKMMDLDSIGDFLVMAAELMRIKSKMLLPPDPNEAAQPEDPRAELVRRLEEYQRIREAAEELRLRADKRSELFARRLDEQAIGELKEDAKEVYFEANLFDLVTALSRALLSKPEEGEYEVVREEYTVEAKVHLILHVLVDRPRVLLTELFESARNKMEVIVTFMAVLELCRLRELLVVQKRLFSDIELVRNSEQIVVHPRPDPSTSTSEGLPMTGLAVTATDSAPLDG